MPHIVQTQAPRPGFTQELRAASCLSDLLQLMRLSKQQQRRRSALYPDDLKYSSEHEWARMADGGTVEVGITYFAQDTLGDVVFVELPEVGSRVDQFDKFGEIESVKAVSDLFSPVSGTVTAINEELEQSPELVNSDPYGDGWIMEVKLADLSDLDELMDAATYEGTLE